MNNSPSTTAPIMKNPHSHRSRGGLVLASGITLTLLLILIASFMPFSGTLGITPSVHAFSKQTREAGAVTFHDKGCEHCHGVNGIGADRGPDLSTIGKRWKPDRIERQIREGGGGMPPFGDALQPDEVKNLVDFLKAKRKAPKVSVAPVAPKPSSDDSGL
jgi:mono/diheme cytochrome c family protein